MDKRKFFLIIIFDITGDLYREGGFQILARISYKKGGDLGVCVHAVLDSRAPPGGIFRLSLSPYLAHFSGASRDVLEGREGNGAFDFFELS